MYHIKSLVPGLAPYNHSINVIIVDSVGMSVVIRSRRMTKIASGEEVKWKERVELQAVPKKEQAEEELESVAVPLEIWEKNQEHLCIMEQKEERLSRGAHG